jgi:hypothetical protein
MYRDKKNRTMLVGKQYIGEQWIEVSPYSRNTYGLLPHKILQLSLYSFMKV